LPCAHTFCLGCLEAYGKDLKCSSKVPCPMCRKKFALPAGGWKNLPRNYIVEKLLSANPGMAVAKNSPLDDTSLSAEYLTKSVTLQIDECQQLADRLKERAEHLSRKSQDVKQDILRHRDELKRLVDSSAEELVSKLDHICESTVQKLQVDQRDMENRCLQLKLVQTKLKEITDASDPKGHLEAVAIEMKPLMSEVKCNVVDADISFTEAQLQKYQDMNIVGCVDVCYNAEIASKPDSSVFQQLCQLTF